MDRNTLALLQALAQKNVGARLAAIAAGHVPQLELMGAKDRNVLALCSRRAAKSTSFMGMLATDAEQNPGVQIYFGKTKPAVRLSIWGQIWRPFCAKHGFQARHNETSMVSTFPNGAVVAFTGTDDVAHVESYLGNELRRAIIDEAQSQSASVLDPLIDRILPPALSKLDGQLCLGGTIPEVPAGKFYDLWVAGEGWRKFNWSRFANPHMGTMEFQLKQLEHYLRTSGKSIDDPIVRRDWFGEFTFDPGATAYQYRRERNGYQAVDPEWLSEARAIVSKGEVRASVPHVGINRFSAGADPGGRDKTSVVVWGWGDTTQEIQQVFEWVTPRETKTSLSDIARAFGLVSEHYGPLSVAGVQYYWDPGSGSMEIDTFGRDYGIPVVKAANKADKPGQVRRNNDLLERGLIQVIVGGRLEEDYMKARWDTEARGKGLWKWANQWHPDPSEAGRYGLQGYYDAYVEPETERSQEELDREAADLAQRRKRARMSARVLEEDEESMFAME